MADDPPESATGKRRIDRKGSDRTLLRMVEIPSLLP